MAHFAKIEDGRVVQVIVVHNDEISNAAALEGEAQGIVFCKGLFGADTVWAQTSYSGAFRGKYAGASNIFDGANFLSVAV